MIQTKVVKSDLAAGQPSWTSAEVSKLFGVSLRQLQWWDEKKVVSPRQEGHKRLYQQEEIVEIGVIAELRRKGFSLQKIRRVLRFLQKELGKRLADIVRGTSEFHLVTDGKSIYLEDSSQRILNILKNAKQAMFVVCVSDQLRRVAQPTMRKPARSDASKAAAFETTRRSAR
jgi:DNA-binding transcriptional MerR regulator